MTDKSSHGQPGRAWGEGAAGVRDVAGSASTLDHKAAVLDLYNAGYAPTSIRDVLLQRGYFADKKLNQVLAQIWSIVNRIARKHPEVVERKPCSRVDEMMRLIEKPKRRYSL